MTPEPTDAQELRSMLPAVGDYRARFDDVWRRYMEALDTVTELAERLKAAERERDEARQDYLNERGHHALTKGTLEEAEAQVDTLHRLADRATDALEAAEAQRDDWRTKVEIARVERRAAEAQRDELVEALDDLLNRGMPYKARAALAKHRDPLESE